MNNKGKTIFFCRTNYFRPFITVIEYTTQFCVVSLIYSNNNKMSRNFFLHSNKPVTHNLPLLQSDAELFVGKHIPVYTTPQPPPPPTKSGLSSIVSVPIPEMDENSNSSTVDMENAIKIMTTSDLDDRISAALGGESPVSYQPDDELEYLLQVEAEKLDSTSLNTTSNTLVPITTVSEDKLLIPPHKEKEEGESNKKKQEEDGLEISESDDNKKKKKKTKRLKKKKDEKKKKRFTKDFFDLEAEEGPLNDEKEEEEGEYSTKGKKKGTSEEEDDSEHDNQYDVHDPMINDDSETDDGGVTSNRALHNKLADRDDEDSINRALSKISTLSNGISGSKTNVDMDMVDALSAMYKPSDLFKKWKIKEAVVDKLVTASASVKDRTWIRISIKLPSVFETVINDACKEILMQDGRLPKDTESKVIEIVGKTIVDSSKTPTTTTPPPDDWHTALVKELQSFVTSNPAHADLLTTFCCISGYETSIVPMPKNAPLFNCGISGEVIHPNERVIMVQPTVIHNKQEKYSTNQEFQNDIKKVSIRPMYVKEKYSDMLTQLKCCTQLMNFEAEIIRVISQWKSTIMFSQSLSPLDRYKEFVINHRHKIIDLLYRYDLLYSIFSRTIGSSTPKTQYKSTS